MAKYSDIDLSFARNPVTNDISILEDTDAIKAAVRNIILTDFGERPFNPRLGSSIRGLLFEPTSAIIASEMEAKIRSSLKNFEPRIKLLRIDVVPKPDQNEFAVSIGFRMTGDSRVTIVPITLQRLR